MEKQKIDTILSKSDKSTLQINLLNIVDTYCTPSFGSLSKHDVDLLIYASMISLGIVQDDASIYDLMRILKITRTKARNLMYEYQLRKIQNDDELKKRLREQLNKPLLSCKSENVSIEIDSPFLIDYIRHELKRLGYITDGSFHSELVTMTKDAFAALYYDILSEEERKQVEKQLIEFGVKEHTSLKTVLPNLLGEVMKTVTHAALGRVGENIMDTCINVLKKVVKDPNRKDTFGDIFK